MKKKNLLFLSVLLGVLSACSSTDDVQMEAGYGAVDLTVTTNTAIETRAESRTSHYVYLPPLEDYVMRVEKTDGDVFVKQDSFKNCESALKLPVGSYKLSVYYGDENEEGYARKHKEDEGIDPYIYGETEFVLTDQEVKSLSVHCTLQRALLNISCSEAFREVYGDSAEVALVTTNNKIIAWDKDDDRTLMVKPGKLKLNINVENGGVPKTFYRDLNLENKGLYNLELKMNAATGVGKVGSILISYDDATREEPVALELEHYTLYPAPYLIFKDASDDGSEEQREIVLKEGMKPTEEESLMVVAKGGLASLTMQTESPYLLANGWPETIDLMSAGEAQKEQLKQWGLEMKGVQSGAQMLSLNFDNVFSRIVASDNTDVETVISFTLTDTNNRTAEKVYQFKCTTMPVNFTSSTSQIDCVWGASEIVVPITMDGDVDMLTASYLAESGVNETCKPTNIEPAEGENAYLVTFPIAIGTGDKNITLSYANGVREQRITAHLLPPVYTLSAEAGDVWSKRASVKLNAEANFLEQISKNKDMVKMQYSTDGTQWTDVQATLDASTMSMSVTGLNPNTAYQVRSLYGDMLMESTVSFTTEEALALENGNMEDWNEEAGKSEYYSIWSVAGWETLNLLTTSEGGSNTNSVSSSRDGMQYCATSSTKRTEDVHSGNYAAWIRSVGYGKGSSVGAGNAGMKKTSAGELFLGTYNNGANYGVDFVSRPSALSFWYKYIPKNSADRFIAELVVIGTSGNEIAHATLPDYECGAQDTYKQKTITLNYTRNEKATQMYVRFVSGTKLEKNSTDFTTHWSVSKDLEYVGAQLYIDDIELIYE